MPPVALHHRVAGSSTAPVVLRLGEITTATRVITGAAVRHHLTRERPR